MSISSGSLSVEEFHGPYGPFQVSELVLQRIWLEGAFDQERLCDRAGRSIVVESPGVWNRLDGPDFLDARLLVDGERVVGDVEVHFCLGDWNAHGHQFDAGYNKVALHVVYHPPRSRDRPVFKENGDLLECAALMPALWYSLEEYACDDSIIASTGVRFSEQVERLMERGREERRLYLVERARERWRAKRYFAAKRIERLGWEGACHQTALEVLGYARNRVPMLMVAERFPLLGLLDGSVDADALWLAGGDRWRPRGSRPANHPRLRLQQYLAWVRTRPCWPDLLAEFGNQAFCQGSSLPVQETDWGSAVLRRELGIAELGDRLTELVLARSVGGARANTLICDGFLPLVEAELGCDCFPFWFHWPMGDGPSEMARSLRQAHVLEPRRFPMGNGWLQGMLGMRGIEEGKSNV
ncbi:DUF2851 family protein [Pelagicoccus sp. SDUM812003]|uniref:DUF2851 family protein n=1 Tax=Pelagicoccus sp. SDUM812003 TaxID=3041267 RepID=UPI00280F0F19|nr:DUF2851 family protein [Pelagicoccus sp. SDUM812003]MDQ8204976.1 DUF2851 family protein [Pelagicoccus sp. SDUM812003]